MSFIEKYDYGTWRIESQLGEGAFSKVYKIAKEEFGHKYYSALKVIPVPQNSSEINQLQEEGIDGDSLNTYVNALVEDLISEINLVRKFEGVTNVVNYEDHKIIPKEDEVGYYILIRMELLESLGKTMKTQKLGEDDAVKVGLDICRALERMEKYKVIHRDIKPENIFVSRDGDYKLGDFGIARRIEKTLSGMSRKGTYNYMAPEVFKGLEYGATVDQYSLGIVLYRILNNGRIPFVLPYVTSVLPSDRETAFNKRIKGESLPPPVEASSELASIILKACSYEPSGRYANASDMRAALKGYAQSKVKVIDVPKPPKAEPKPEPEPKSEPEPKPKPKPKPEPKPEPKLEPEPKREIWRSAEADTIVEPEPLPEPHDVTDEKSELIKGHSVSFEERPLPKNLVAKPGVIILLAVLASVACMAAFVLLPRVNDASNEMATNDLITTADHTQTEVPAVTKAPTPTAKPTDDPVDHVEINGIIYEISSDQVSVHFKELTSTDMANLTLMKNLRALSLDGAKLTNITPIATLINLEYLSLWDNQIADISPLSKLTNLEKLYLDRNEISDLRPISKLTNLEILNLRQNKISDLRPISKLTNLKTLNLQQNQVSDLSPLSELKNLKSLGVSQNKIEYVSSLSNSNLTNLEILELVNNNIRDISPLSKLYKLKILEISSNNITDVSPLSKLTNLVDLSLSDNNISDISSLSNLINLKELYVKGNPIPQEQIDDLKESLPNCNVHYDIQNN